MSEPRPIGWSLDTSSLLDDLSRMTKVISGVLDAAVVQEALHDVRRLVDESTSRRELIGLALLADCLRIIAAGTSDESEEKVLDACLPLLAAIGRQFKAFVPGYDALPPVTRPATARLLVTHYRTDDGPLGCRHLATKWAGLQLCRQAAADGDDEVLDIYGRIAHRLFDDVLATAGPGIDSTERDELFRLIEEPKATPSRAPDRRSDVFVARNIPVFSPVAHATPAAGRDPLDVEEVHREARVAFASILDRATGQPSDRGRMLLVIGDSGCGKTHLLRALRTSVHARRRGHAALVQLHSRTDNYARYLMGALVESMEQEYDPPEDMRTGLLQLTNGLVELLPPDAKEDVDRLRGSERTEPLQDGQAVHLVEKLVDALSRVAHFLSFDRDLLRVLLHEQRRDTRIHAVVMKYLRCRDMSELDRRLLGGIPPLTDPDDPLRTIVQLARLIRLTQGGALVFLLDQVEDQSTDSGYRSFGEAVNTIRRITEEASSTAAVFACLDSFYEEASSRLDRSAIDRLERDPERETLRVGRTLPEIEVIVARRLEHLYTSQGTEFLADAPTFPIPQRTLQELDNRRLRDVLDECRKFRDACQAAGRLVADASAPSPSASEGPAPHLEVEQLDLALNDERTNAAEPPTDGAAVLAILVDAMRLVSRELGVAIEAHEIAGPLLRITTSGRSPIVVGFTNKNPAGGGFGSEVRDLRAAAAEQAATAVAARLSEFPTGPKSTAVIQQLQAGGGRNVVVHLADLRMVAAVRALADKSPPDAFERWLTDCRPLSSMASIQNLLDIADMVDQAAAVPETAASTSTPPPAPQERPDPVADGQIRLGRLASRNDQPCYLDVNRLTRHCAILGASGSGKTVAALNLVEQALEQSVPVVLVDRKGDLAGYADARWWAQPGRDEAATRRKRALERRLDIRLFTPGAPDGRQLGLPAVPAIDGLADYEREATIKHASAALAALARLGPTSPPASILEVAIGLLARAGNQPSLPDLIELIEDRDPELLAEAGRFDDRYFRKLVETLETIRLANRQVFTSHGEQLSAERLFRADRPDRVALSIVSTKFLGTYEVIQLWVSRLICEIARFASRAPADRLQAIVMFDEADTYLPAGSKPPTKEAMMDLLRRARSGGIGVLLASQSPGDFDYKAREQISTWLVGKVGANSIAKMRPLFEHRGGAVQTKLGQLSTGHFFEMSEEQVRPVTIDRALLETRQLSDAAIHDLARRQRSGR